MSKVKYFFVLFITSFCFSQKNIADSLQKVLWAPTLNDTNRVNTLNMLFLEFYKKGDIASSDSLSKLAFNLANKINYRSGVAHSKINLGIVCEARADYLKALEYFNGALKTYEKLNNPGRMASCYSKIALIYDNQAKYDEAIKYYLKALKIDEAKGNTLKIAGHHGNMALVYTHMQQFDKAIEEGLLSIKLYEGLNYKYGIANVTVGLGNVYGEKREFEKALQCYNTALKIDEEMGFEIGAAKDLANIGMIYEKKNDYEKAEHSYLQSSQIFLKAGDKASYSINVGSIGQMFLNRASVNSSNQKQYLEKAEKNLLEAIRLSTEIGDRINTKNWHYYLSGVYAAQNNWERSLDHYVRSIAIRDSIFTTENTKNFVRAEMNFEFEKKQLAEKMEQEKKDAIQEGDAQKRSIFLWSACGLLILVVFFSVFVYRNVLQKQKANKAILEQKHIIEDKQKEILDSIHYAKRIQTALLSNEKYIHKSINRLSDTHLNA